MSQPKEIFIRLDRCMGCHSCEMACAVEHSAGKTLYTALSDTPTPKQRLHVEWVAPDHSVPIVCRNCEEAPCMNACIAGAISRSDEGIVTMNTDECIGCWTCVMVCHYGVIGRHLETQTAYRCDRCPECDQPACVAACPTHALVYQSVDQYSVQQRQRASRELVYGEEV